MCFRIFLSQVAMAMAAKAKLLLRELKTVKADLAFAKERCGQLEEENRVIRESSAKGGSLEDDDLVCVSTPTSMLLSLSSIMRAYKIQGTSYRFFLFIHGGLIVGCYRYFKL